MKSKRYFWTILLALLFSVNGKSYAQSPNWLWAKTLSGKGDSFPNSIAVDPATGGVYTVGEFFGTVDFDPDSVETFNLTAQMVDAFISKIDSSGNFIWAIRMGGGMYDFGNSIALDPVSGDVYTTGYFIGAVDFDPSDAVVFNLSTNGSPNIYISKLTGEGKFVWAKAITGPGDEWDPSIAVDKVNGDVYIKGQFSGTADFDPGPKTSSLTSSGGYVMFISKLNSAGDFEWAKRIGGAGSVDYDNSIGTIAVDPSGSGAVYTTGHYRGTVDFDPGTGIVNLTSVGDDDIFISKLDAFGNFRWAKSIGGSQYDVGHGIAVDLSGNVYTTGLFHSTVDFDPGIETNNMVADSADIFISKLDEFGNFVWAKKMDGTGNDKGYSLAVDLTGSGDVYTTGYFSGTVDFDPGTETFPLTSAGGWDIFISRLNDNGDFAWALAIGGTEEDRGGAITLDALGHVYLAGHFRSPFISFGPTTLINAGSAPGKAQIYIAKLNTSFFVSVANVDFTSNKINIFPNPASDELIIAFDGDKSINVQMTMYNDLREVVLSGKYENIVREKTIDIGALATGIYFIELNIDGKRVVEKVVKE